ncbi:hypothetical protein G6F60_012396 [Rhizopus arrhizus]|nr:hypothetical protein G6F60_012396 [Rhizopus arrhizus]
MPKSLSADIKNDIKPAQLAGKVSMNVANRLGVAYATVNNYANKFFPNRQRGLGGRPMVVSAQTKRFIKLQVVQGQLKTARKVHDKLMELGVWCSDGCKHGGGSLMMWGCMTYEGPGYACQIYDGTMHSDLYQHILDTTLRETMKYYDMDWSTAHFQHDGDPKHRSKSTIQWLNANRVNYIDDWPAQSPDLYPIEHIWHHLKLKLSLYDKKAKGVHELWERVEKEWNSFDKEACRRYIDTMPARIKAVIDAKGGSTKY